MHDSVEQTQKSTNMATRPECIEDSLAFCAFIEDFIFESKLNLPADSPLFDVPALWAVSDPDTGQPGSCAVDARIDELELLIAETID